MFFPWKPEIFISRLSTYWSIKLRMIRSCACSIMEPPSVRSFKYKNEKHSWPNKYQQNDSFFHVMLTCSFFSLVHFYEPIIKCEKLKTIKAFYLSPTQFHKKRKRNVHSITFESIEPNCTLNIGQLCEGVYIFGHFSCISTSIMMIPHMGMMLIEIQP